MKTLFQEVEFFEELDKLQLRVAGEKGGTMKSPFTKPEKTEKRLKLFLWGDTGSGKTTTALRFPAPAVIDMEGGTDHYSEDFKFFRARTTDADEAQEAIDFLLTQKHDYKTLVIDPITVLWEALQKKWNEIFLMRNKSKKGFRHEWYDLDFKDWGVIKSDLKSTLRKILALDMNVVCCARQKLLHPENGAMKSATEVFDGEKSLPYLFDSILHLYRKDDGTFWAHNVKDRTGRLPEGNFVMDYETVSAAWSSLELDRACAPLKQATLEQQAKITELAEATGIDGATFKARLESYGAENVAELTDVNAGAIIEKLTAYLARKGGK
jgi:hypothetical protein